MTAAPDITPASVRPDAARVPLTELEPDPSSPFDRFLVGLFITVPLLAVAAAVPVAWRWGLGWHDVVIGLVFYVITGMGITMGFHRHFTHTSFKAAKPLRLALGIAGSMAIEGPVAGLGR